MRGRLDFPDGLHEGVAHDDVNICTGISGAEDENEELFEKPKIKQGMREESLTPRPSVQVP